MMKLALCAILVSVAPMAAADEIRVLNRQGYGTDLDWAVAAFEEKTGNTVVHEYFTTQQELLAKLRANPGAYDVVAINSTFAPQAVEEGLIGPIDRAAIPHLAQIDPMFLDNPDLNAGGALQGVPWTWGLTAFAVNSTDFPEPPASLAVFWDPAWKGRVSIRDDALEAVQFAALATGQDINDIRDLEAVRGELETLMPQIRTLWTSEGDWSQAMAAGEVAVATYGSDAAARALRQGLPIAFVMPEEGAIGWVDGLAIPTASTRKAQAAAFIDWMIDPEFYLRWDEEGSPAPTSLTAAETLPEESFNRMVLGDPEVVALVQFLRPAPEAKRAEYLALWQGVKAKR